MEDCEKETTIEYKKTTVYTRGGQLVAKCIKTDHSEHWYNAGGRWHRDDGPAMIWYQNGQKTEEYWYRNGERRRDDGPAMILYENGQKTYEGWYCDDKYHRDDGPAEICYKDGKKNRERWYRDGKLGGNVLAYVWLADTNEYTGIGILGGRINTLDEFRDAVKGPLALELMRPLPIPIREAIFEHYCLQ